MLGRRVSGLQGLGLRAFQGFSVWGFGLGAGLRVRGLRA